MIPIYNKFIVQITLTERNALLLEWQSQIIIHKFNERTSLIFGLELQLF